MGWANWTFRFDDDGWRRVPAAWYDRFFDGKDTTPDPPGTLLRFAQVAVELEEREPIRLGRIWYVVHGVAEGGRIDQVRQREVLHTAAELTCLPFLRALVDQVADSVIHAEDRFAERRYRHFAGWEPSPEQSAGLSRELRRLGVPC